MSPNQNKSKVLEELATSQEKLLTLQNELRAVNDNIARLQFLNSLGIGAYVVSLDFSWPDHDVAEYKAGHVYKIEAITENDIKAEGKHEWYPITKFRKAEPNEIRDHLVKEAEAKGWTRDVNILAKNGGIHGVLCSVVAVTSREQAAALSASVFTEWNSIRGPFLVVKYNYRDGPFHETGVAASPLSHFEIDNTIYTPRIHGYDAIYKKGSKTITFGCATIDIDMLRIFHAAMVRSSTVNIDGNRTVTSVTLSSGKSLTLSDIHRILEYVQSIDDRE